MNLYRILHQRRKLLLFLSVLLYVNIASLPADETRPSGAALGEATMKIRIVFTDGSILTGTLEDTAASRSFIAQLPLNVVLEDYHGMEKIFYPPEKLDIRGAASGYQASAGDITYYAPWGDVAIFTRDFSMAPGLVYLGRLDTPIGRLQASTNAPALIELVSGQDNSQ